MKSLRPKQGGGEFCPGASTGQRFCHFIQRSEWLDNNENHDSDHQQSRNFVNNTVKLVRARVAVLGKIADPAPEQPMRTEKEDHQKELAVQPAGAKKPRLEGEPK